MSQVHFIVDEAASLKQMDAIGNALDVGRAYGIRLLLIYQSVGQLKKCFPQGQDETVLATVSKVFMGVSDLSTAEYVSNSIGEATIMVESSGTSSGTSHQFSQGEHSQRSKGDSYNSNRNVQPQARKLLKPEEIIQLDERLAIAFAPNVPPVLTRLLRYYEEPQLGRRSGWLGRACAACMTLVMSLVVLGGALLVADGVSEEAERMNHIESVPQFNQSDWPQPGRTPYGRRMNDRGGY